MRLKMNIYITEYAKEKPQNNQETLQTHVSTKILYYSHTVPKRAEDKQLSIDSFSPCLMHMSCCRCTFHGTAKTLRLAQTIISAFNVPDCPVSTANITEYIDALGYYNTVNLLCKHIIDTTVTDGYTGVLNYPLPLLFLGMTCVPIIYINGKMLPMRYYSYQTLPDTNICKVTISSSIYVRPGDTITALLHLTENNNVYLFTPEANNLTCNITYSTPQVYQILDVDLIRSINRTTTNSYKPCGRYANIYTTIARTDGTTDVTFNDQYIGKTFIISNSNASYVKTYDLAEYKIWKIDYD